MRRAGVGWAAGVLGALLISTTTCVDAALADPNEGGDKLLDLNCGPFRYVDLTPIDYRLKYVSPEAKSSVATLDRFHTEPAREEMRKPNPYAASVMGNLDFTLRHSPNHHEALWLLIQYEISGGKLLTYPKARCYLDWARRFAPDDADVLLYGGNYFWKTGEMARAKAWYSGALQVNPASADALYNLGLLEFEIKDYASARDHARAAYAAGYPLPGLRNMLARAGYPLDSAEAPAAGEKR